MIKLVPVEPIAEDSGPAFVTRANGCGFEMVPFKRWAESERGAALRERRVHEGEFVAMSDVARALGIRAAEYSALESGRGWTTDEAGWAEVYRVLADLKLRAARASRGP